MPCRLRADLARNFTGMPDEVAPRSGQIGLQKEYRALSGFGQLG